MPILRICMIMVKLIVWQNVNVKTNGPRINAMKNANRKPKSARMTFFACITVRNFAICAMEETVINVKTNGPKRNARSAMPFGARRAKSVRRSVRTLAIYVIWQQPQVRNSTITFDQYRYRYVD